MLPTRWRGLSLLLRRHRRAWGNLWHVKVRSAASVPARSARRLAALAAATALALPSCGRTNDGGVEEYVDDGLSAVRGQAYYATRIDWARIGREADEVVAAATDRNDTYPFLQYVLDQLDDPHARLVRPGTKINTGEPSLEAPVQMPDGRRLESGAGYIRIPAIRAPHDSTPAEEYVASAHNVFAAMDACGWVVDLRGNGGGVITPMLAALAPVLGEGKAVGYSSRSEPTFWWSISRTGVLGDKKLSLRFRHPPQSSRGSVAVLVDTKTASSGEGAAVALIENGARSFGHATAGLATGTGYAELDDGAVLLFSNAVATGLSGNRYEGGIVPAEPLASQSANDTADQGISRAEAWLPSCR